MEKFDRKIKQGKYFLSSIVEISDGIVFLDVVNHFHVIGFLCSSFANNQTYVGNNNIQDAFFL